MRDLQDGILMEGVSEYCEEYAVRLVETTGAYRSGKASDCPGFGRPAIKAYNEGGYNSTEVDLLEVLAWVKKNRPDLWDATEKAT